MAFSYSSLFFAGLLLAVIINTTVGVAETLNAKAAANVQNGQQGNLRATQTKEINLHNAAKYNDDDDEDVDESEPASSRTVDNKASASSLSPTMTQIADEGNDEEDESEEKDQEEETPSSMLSMHEEGNDDGDDEPDEEDLENAQNPNHKAPAMYEAPNKSHADQQESNKMRDDNAEDNDDSVDFDN